MVAFSTVGMTDKTGDLLSTNVLLACISAFIHPYIRNHKLFVMTNIHLILEGQNQTDFSCVYICLFVCWRYLIAYGSSILKTGKW